MRRLLISILFCVCFISCKKKEYPSVFQEWAGDWKLIEYYYGGYNKPMGGGPYVSQFSRRSFNDSFLIWSLKYTTDTPGQAPHAVYDEFVGPAQCIIKTKLSVDSLTILEDYTVWNSSGSIAYHWTFTSGLKLKPKVYEYGWTGSSAQSAAPQWQLQDGVLTYRDENGYPGSGGGTHYEMYRSFRKIK